MLRTTIYALALALPAIPQTGRAETPPAPDKAVRAALKPAPPEPLMLVDVEYAGVSFRRSPSWLRPKQGWLRRLTAQSAGAWCRKIRALTAAYDASVP